MATTKTATKIGVFRDFDEIESLIRSFESGLLPRAKWDHRAHLTMASWYLICYPEPEATRRIRQGIRRYNEAVGILTTANSGYHETMTVFWIRLVKHYLSRATLECSIVNLINDLTARYSNRALPFEFYSRDRLMSPDARARWVEPDLKDLP